MLYPIELRARDRDCNGVAGAFLRRSRSPPTTRHGTIQAYVARELARQRPDGTAITECPVEADISMRMPDVVWASAQFMARHGTEKQFRVSVSALGFELPFPPAP